jgi:Membrane bound O-acyl transferase family
MTPAALLPLVALPGMAMLMQPRLPAWMFMWVMAASLYAGCKWITFRDACDRGIRGDRLRTLGYLLVWPGMDATTFLQPGDVVRRPQASEWIAAAFKTAFGVCLTWVVARTALPARPMLAGWIAMAGLIFILHFGTFHLLSLAWRACGVAAAPIMRNPLASTSLAEFWGRRWNVAFHELASRFTFRPLKSIVGAVGATLLVFVVSGLVHELVISVPARGGYGLPTMYFVVQGLGLAGERARWGRQLGLGHGARGWLFTALVTAGPAVWLFPAPFVRGVILPMLAALGAI